MLVNHETGAIQPVRELARQLAGRAAFHCDATQAVGKLPVHFHDLGVTSLALSAHKFHGPKGVGALLLRRGTKLRPRTWGGHQQQGRRPGTEAVALAVGLAAALDLACREMEQRTRRSVRSASAFGGAARVGRPAGAERPADGGAPHTVNVSFPGLKADALLMALDLAGVACSTGSACSSGSLLPSPVLRAMGVSEMCCFGGALQPQRPADAGRDRRGGAADRGGGAAAAEGLIEASGGVYPRRLGRNPKRRG